ncbi:sn-glycerol-3-phosphate ABC transporter ATP-binding protein UgpC [Halomonas sp. NO4]|uniref:ABC transporter ATP-binding protein n=1 Tax=Halomonas sp. NO4 TaxID=2484813 RepID=UPI0013D5A5E1|nr:sn-glycerol-3-phosphate ABC transporter ATP-binding protein UgpC [Halomonas sp. NO4]
MASVEIMNAVKAYGDQQVLHSINIHVEDGEFVVLVGPSGCGKSTLLRMIAGLEDITDGEILIDGKVVNTKHPKDRDIAMVFQSYALYPHMTVEENMAFSLKMQKRDKEEQKQKVAESARILDLTKLLDRYPRQLSGGQRQRVAMGRAIVRDPKVFLFDEPLSNLDAKLRVQMRTEIRSLHQKLKTTVVYVTHDQVEAMTMADKIVVMHDGYIEQIGSPLNLYDQPANLFVAGFMGSPSMNLIKGRMDRSDPHQFVTQNGKVIRLPCPVDIDPGRELVIGIRPEHFEVSDEGTEFEVEVIEPTGSEIQVILNLGGEKATAAFRDRLPLEPGDKVRLGMSENGLHFFDSQSGNRLSPDLYMKEVSPEH